VPRSAYALDGAADSCHQFWGKALSSLPSDPETFALGDSSAYPMAPGISAPSGRPADWFHRELTTKFNTATETLTAGFCEIDFLHFL